jgi:hypothetical protein
VSTPTRFTKCKARKFSAANWLHLRLEAGATFTFKLLPFNFPLIPVPAGSGSENYRGPR